MKRTLVVLACAMGFLLMYWTMSHGPGISPDSIIYLQCAQSILAGHGLVVSGLPMTHFPPIYPLLLAAVGLLDHDLLHAARLLATICFGANLMLVGFAVYFATGGRLRPAAAAAALFLVSAPLLDLHAMAWSEAPFMAFTLTGLLVLSAAVDNHRRRMLALASISLGLAAGTRYVGIALFPVLCFVLWFMGERSFRDRVVDTLVALPLAAAPLTWWLVRNAITAHGVTDRHLVWHPVTTATLGQMVETLSDFLFPLSWNVTAKLVVLLAILALLAAAWWHRPVAAAEDWSARLGRNLSRIALLFSASYLALLLLSISLADASTPLDDRILFPCIVSALVGGIIIGDRFVHSRRGFGWPLAVLVGVLLSLGLRARGAWETVLRVHRDGSGYASEAWQHSPAIAQLASLSSRTRIYSNASEAIGYLTDRSVLALPDSIVPETLLPNPRYRVELDALCLRVSEGWAVAAYLTTEGIGDPDQKGYLERVCAFPSTASYPDGTIYSAKPLQERAPLEKEERGPRSPGVVSAFLGRVGREGQGSYIPPPKAR